MKQILVLSLLVISGIRLFAVTVPSDKKTPINGSWEFIRSDLGNPWEAVRPVKPGKPESVPLWSEVTVPHCFNAGDGVDPDVNYYEGPGWYRKKIAISNPYPDGRTILEFEGAGQNTDVYIGTRLLCSHTGGYDGFSVDITDEVKGVGEVQLLVRCDNTRNTQTIPSDMSDFNLYGGLYRPINLVYLPVTSLEAIKITPVKSGDAWRLDVEAGLSGKQSDIQFSLAVRDATGKAVATMKKSSSGGLLKMSAPISAPHLWSPSDPYLYCVTLSCAGWSSTEKVGFRTFRFIDRGPFHLNGSRLLLRGTHRHEDHAGVGAAMTDAMTRTEMKMMKDMGVNFIRLGHYQQSETVLNLCDSLGILVWEEIPWCRGGLGGERYKEQSKRMLANMIAQHRNHPSVIIWGLGNENDWPGDFPEFDKEAIRGFMQELHKLSHSLDDSRLTAIRRCSFCSDVPDIYSPSIWAGWYKGQFRKYREYSDTEMAKVKHFLHVEWGGDSHAGRHSEEMMKNNDIQKGEINSDWSETYIVHLVDWHLKEQLTMPTLTGTAFWPFKDFSTPLRPDNPVPYVNQKGAVQRDFAPKEIYYVFQSYWTDKPMVHIYGHSWPVRWGDEGEAKRVLVYSNCDAAELFLNGVSQGVKKRNPEDFPGAGLRWECKYREGANELRVVARKGSSVVQDSITQSYQTARWGKEAVIRLSKEPVSQGVMKVNVNVTDEAGVPCLDSDRFVRFSHAGDGKLVDNLGTPGGSRRVQLCNGRASICIRTSGGVNVVAVSSAGLKTATIAL